MKTDRKLLELAARAYFAQEVADGVCSFWWDEEDQAIVYIHGANQDHNGNDVELLWIPRDDDGDALRLAVKLDMSVKQDDPNASIAGWSNLQRINITHSKHGPWYWKEWLRDHENDRTAATRRAIVRAAAAIGEAM